MATTTRKDLRQRIGGVGYLNDMFSSTTSAQGAAAGATLIDTKYTVPNDAPNYGEIILTSGTSSGDIRIIADWVQSTGTLTPDRAFSNQIAASVSYEIHRIFGVSEKNDAINEALRQAKFRFPRYIENTSLTLASTTYTYSLASLTVEVDQYEGIDVVEYDNDNAGTGYSWTPLSPEDWRIVYPSGVQTLQLLIDPPIIGNSLRLKYRARPALFTADTSTGGELNPDHPGLAAFVCAKASELLCMARAANEREADRRDHWFAHGQRFQQMADGIFSTDLPQRKPKPIKFGAWGRDEEADNSDVTRIRV